MPRLWGLNDVALDAFLAEVDRFLATLPPGSDRSDLAAARAAAEQAFDEGDHDKALWISRVIELTAFGYQAQPGAAQVQARDARLREQAADAANERRMQSDHPFDDRQATKWQRMAAVLTGSKHKKAKAIVRRLELPADWVRTVRDNI